LGKFHLVGLPPAPRGIPQIEVAFDIDANGIVNVSAKDRGTGKEQKITITSSGGLKQEEVDQMMKEAELHAEDDKKQHELIETRNKADQAVYAGERMLQDSGDKLSEAERSAIEAAIADVKQALEVGETDAIVQAMEKLNTAQHKAAETLYKSGQESETSAPDADTTADTSPDASASSEEDVIDAEVVEDEKK
ncbi:MAG: Hsp70 family protein, partial [Acidobacteria bacterium]|nr:Hsp70 family protein [Acidobacteriota bacterium]